MRAVGIIYIYRSAVEKFVEHIKAIIETKKSTTSRPRERERKKERERESERERERERERNTAVINAIRSNTAVCCQKENVWSYNANSRSLFTKEMQT